MKTNLFHLIEGESVILRSRGVFSQVDLYERNGELFAQKGSGFIRLMANDSTSVPNIMVEHITYDGVKLGTMGKLLKK